MRAYEITEVFQAGNFPDEHTDEQFFINSMLNGASKVEQLNKNLSLWSNGDRFSLIKDDTTVLGGVKLEQVTICGAAYSHIDFIYVVPAYRNTSAAKWLLYAIKEYSEHPVIADGAIFNGGYELIGSILRRSLHKVQVLNKKTGEITPYDGPLNDADSCFLFEQMQMGYGKIYEDFNRFVWYNWFEEIA